MGQSSTSKFCSISCGNGRPPQERSCETCGVTFTAWASKIAQGGGRFCSTACYGKSRAGVQNNRWAGDEVAYAGAHKRVQAANGSASEWFCTDCPKPTPADHWSYDGLDQDELTDEQGRRYSAKPEHYQPRCVACHNRYDIGSAARGERNGQARLTQADAREILQLYESTKHLSRRHPERWTHRKISGKLGVSKGCVSTLLSGATWAWAGTSPASTATR
jgi:hypothetical protein